MIENGVVAKRYTIDKNRLHGFSLTHCQSGKRLCFDETSELFVLRFQGAFGGELVKASELKIAGAEKKESSQSMTLLFSFKPFKIRGCKVQLQWEETIGAFDCFLQSRLVFQTVSGDGEKAVLDHIDFAPLAVREGANIWTAQQPEKEKRSEAFALRLGQPVFFENCFFGCAFPAAEGGIRHERLFLRRYYGRSLTELCDASGVFYSDGAVCGAAANASYLAVRERFFSYIEKTALPFSRSVSLQLQSEPQETETAALRAEKSFQKAGLPFAKTLFLNKQQLFPEKALWAFDQTLPPSVLSLQKTAGALGASLGLLLGVEAEKKKGLLSAFKSKEEICPADSAFLQKLQDFLRLCAENGITSFYLNLPFLSACRDKTRDHARGGEKLMYYYSDLWEKWINLLSLLRKASPQPLRFVLQNAPLSPWLLQWVDSIALPENGPKGPLRMDFATRQKLLDIGRYHCLKTLSLCFPQNRLFTALSLDEKAAGTPDVLFSALAKNALCAGEQLWIASPSALEKAALSLRGMTQILQTMEPALRGGLMFGGDPVKNEPYGFSAFDGAGGVLVLCNPGSLAATFSFALDEQCGAPKQLSAIGLCSLLPLLPQTDSTVRRFDNLLTQPLAPGETRVLQLGRRAIPPKAAAFAESETKLRVFCSQPLDFSHAVCEENQIRKAERLMDSCSAVLEFAYPFHTANDLHLTGVRDLLQNETALSLGFACGERGLMPPGAIKGTGPFSIRVTIGGEGNADFYMQGNQIALQSRADAVSFRVGNTVLHARTGSADVVQICAVREITGALKLYLNQQLDCGILPVSAPVDILPAAPLCFDPSRTKVFDHALGFDEV